MSLIPRTTSRNGGFTLVEVLAAVLLLSIAILAIMTANTAARGAQTRAVGLSIGRNVAQSIVDQLRAAPINNIKTMTFPTSDSSLPAGNTIAVAVAGYPTSTEANLFKATVAVSWPEAGSTRTIQYETLIARR
jgi:prepilin-type N-terminal cleavage/methylation domain-containing protein